MMVSLSEPKKNETKKERYEWHRATHLFQLDTSGMALMPPVTARSAAGDLKNPNKSIPSHECSKDSKNNDINNVLHRLSPELSPDTT